MAARVRDRARRHAGMAHSHASGFSGVHRQRNQQDVQLPTRSHRRRCTSDLRAGVLTQLQRRHRVSRRQPRDASALDGGDRPASGRSEERGWRQRAGFEGHDRRVGSRADAHQANAARGGEREPPAPRKTIAPRVAAGHHPSCRNADGQHVRHDYGR